MKIKQIEPSNPGALAESMISKNWKLLKWLFWSINVIALGGVIAVIYFARTEKDKYTPYALQSDRVYDLSLSSVEIMPILRNNLTQPDIGNDIKTVLNYFVAFKYIPAIDYLGEINYEPFNAAVDAYVQWPLAAQTAYVNTVDQFYQNALTSTTITPEYEQWKIKAFAQDLKNIKMTLHADLTAYSATSWIPMYIFIPIGVFALNLGVSCAYTIHIPKEIRQELKKARRAGRHENNPYR